MNLNATHFFPSYCRLHATNASTLQCFSCLVNWPYGEYGLPKPRSECPDTTWKKGWRIQGLSFSSYPSFDSLMDVERTPYLNRTFCMKNDPENTKIKNILWPEGN